MRRETTARGPGDRISSVLIHALAPARDRSGPLVLLALLLGTLWLPAPTVSAQEAVSPLPPPVTRGIYRSRWFQFLNAHLEDDARGATAALEEMKKTARAVGVHRLSDFSRTAVHEGRKAEALGRVERARRAYLAAMELDDANLDAQMSRIGLLLRHRAYGEVSRQLPELGYALLATHESRLVLLSALAVWAGAGFAATLFAFVLVLVVRHLPRIGHNLREIGDKYFGPRAAAPLALIVLALPFAFGLGPFWAGLCWAALVLPFTNKVERRILAVALVVLGGLPPMISILGRRNIIERSPLSVAAVDLEEQREDANAEDGLRQASTVFSEDPDVWFLLGIYAERSGDTEQALASYDRTIQADPRDYRPFLNRGNVHFQEGDFSEAIRDYEAAAQRAPRAAEAYYNLSIARGEAYDFDGQAAAMARAREISESKVRGWTEHPTLARVVSAPYPLSRARRKIEQWNAQAKSRRLPGHAPPLRVQDLLLSPLTLGPWVILALGLLLAEALESRRVLAAECTRCAKPFCSRCKKIGDPVLYCSDCVRLYLRKESAGIEAHVAQTQEAQQRTRRKDWGCRTVSFFLPGAHLGIAGRPLASFSVLFLFLSFLSIAVINVRLFDPRPLPPPHAWRLIFYAPLALAALVWLWSQAPAWKESHGP